MHHIFGSWPIDENLFLINSIFTITMDSLPLGLLWDGTKIRVISKSNERKSHDPYS